MNKPRTLKHFPKMKHRAAGRLARKDVGRLLAVVELMPKFTEMIQEWVRIINKRVAAAMKSIQQAQKEASQSDFALVPAPVVHELSPEIRARLAKPQFQITDTPLSAQTAAILARSPELAVQRGHIRRYS